jgi:hypothetical protein
MQYFQFSVLNDAFISSTIIDIITFERSGMFINPSRADPISVKMSPTGPTGSIYALRGNAQVNYLYAVFTSVLLITASNLGGDADTAAFHGVSGLLCSQEWERFCAFFCTVFKETQLAAQIRENAISITTRAKPKDGAGTGTSPYVSWTSGLNVAWQHQFAPTKMS